MKPSEKTEHAFRFGCGFLFGLLFFGLSSIWYVSVERGIYVAMVLGAAIVFGLAAMRFGDAFWRWFGRWFSWFS